MSGQIGGLSAAAAEAQLIPWPAPAAPIGAAEYGERLERAPVRDMKTLFCGLMLGIGLLTSVAARAADDATSRFHDLYTREWTWREAQFAGEDDEDQTHKPADHLPQVDAATQDSREQYWEEVLRELADIDASTGSGELRGLRGTDQSPRRGSTRQGMADAAQQRHVVLDRPRFLGTPAVSR
jgi:hypothetical protein